ncbi:hypothetical protein NMY22_g18147 [Coprinellus aureogranulatus]|nr:hypothetical protein NMY22_g18147 [Coprinellus aureogranulatus]
MLRALLSLGMARMRGRAKYLSHNLLRPPHPHRDPCNTGYQDISTSGIDHASALYAPSPHCVPLLHSPASPLSLPPQQYHFSAPKEYQLAA